MFTADRHKMLELFLIAQHLRAGCFEYAVMLRGMIQQRYQVVHQIL